MSSDDALKSQITNGFRGYLANYNSGAIRRFLENWWIRSGRPNHSVWEQGDVLWLLSALEPQQDNKPADPAMWSDWELALRQVMEERQSGQSQDG